MAILVIWQMMKFFDRINDGEHWVGQVLASWHISIGVLLLLLVLPRIFWALRNQDNRPAAPEAPTHRALTKAGHAALYIAMALLPITGISIMIGNGYGLSFFGLELVPAGTDIPWLASFGGALHSPVAWVLAALVIGHVVMALWHQFVRKDGLLLRMA